MAQQLKSGLLNAARDFVVQRQIFVKKIHVSYSQPFLIVPFSICCISNSLLYVPIGKELLDFLQHQLFLSLTVLTVTILFIVNLFLIASSTTYHISYNFCFSYRLVLFVLFYCINYLLESVNPFTLVLLLGMIFISATHIRPFCLRSHYISNSSKLLLSVHRISYQVVLSSVYMR